VVVERSSQPKMSPAQYYAALRACVENSERRSADGPLVARVPDVPSALSQFMEIQRFGRPNFKISKAFFSCFFDLILPDVRDILRVSDKALRRIRNWVGVSHWPRIVVMTNTHPALNVHEVLKARIAMMGWALDNDFCAYEMLFLAHHKAGCSMDGFPVPPQLQGPPPTSFAPARQHQLSALARKVPLTLSKAHPQLRAYTVLPPPLPPSADPARDEAVMRFVELQARVRAGEVPPLLDASDRVQLADAPASDRQAEDRQVSEQLADERQDSEQLADEQQDASSGEDTEPEPPTHEALDFADSCLVSSQGQELPDSCLTSSQGQDLPAFDAELAGYLSQWDDCVDNKSN